MFCHWWNNHGHVYKILEWQRSQDQEERVPGERRMIVPVQEVGNGERQEEELCKGIL